MKILDHSSVFGPRLRNVFHVSGTARTNVGQILEREKRSRRLEVMISPHLAYRGRIESVQRGIFSSVFACSHKVGSSGNSRKITVVFPSRCVGGSRASSHAYLTGT